MNLLQQLIQIDSQSGNEKKIQEFVTSYFESLNLSVYHINGNVAVKIRGADESKAIIFNAHVDTVSTGDPSNWDHDPFSGFIDGDMLYGLGASDEKAGVASIMLLAKHFSKIPTPCDLWFTFVVNEELDGSGTRDTMDHLVTKQNILEKYKKISGILVEPTCLQEIEIGHKGNAFVLLTVHGDSGHGSLPKKLKVNVVITMSAIIQKLIKLDTLWSKKYKDPILGNPSIGIGTFMSAGEKGTPNKFPDKCELTLDIRTIPSMHKKVLHELKHYLNTYPVKVVYLYEPAPYGQTKKHDTIVRAVQLNIPKVTITTSEGSTDQCFFTQLGIPAVILGPGEKTCIHKPNEYCNISKVRKAVELYKSIIIDWVKLTST